MAHGEQEARNVALVRAMYEQVLFPLDATHVDRFIAEDYIQHSTMAEPGREALKAWLRARREDSPDAHQTIHRMLADGELVATHLHVVRWKGDRGVAVVDMYRIEGDRIAEHWEVIQELPQQPINPNSMF